MADNSGGPTAADTLYAVADCERLALQNGGVLLIHRHDDSQMVVSQEVSTALHACRSFRTLPEHADLLASTIPQLADQQANVMQVLEMVRDHGLMSTADSACERLCPPDTPPAIDLPPTRVFIITCDRPAAVERLLQSMLHAGNMSHHEHLFLIDDSRDPQNAAQNREAVARFNLTCPRDMHYVGAEAQQGLMRALIAELPEAESAVRFLIDRQRWADKKSYGLARSLCLLLSVDCRAIVLDDDVICAAVVSPHTRQGLLFGDRPGEVDFYTSQEDIQARTARADFDPLTGHARCLGLGMAQAIRKLGFNSLEPPHLRGASTACLDLWQADSPVLITQSGTLGDPGTPGTNWILTLPEASARRALAHPGGVEAALGSRHYWMGQPSPRFGKFSVISQVIGLDNSHLLPPYFPVFRNEDFLFSSMVEYLHPHAATLEYPWAVPHFPLKDRRGATEVAPISGRGSLNPGKYITDHTLYRRGVSAETRLTSLSALIRGLGETSDEDLRALYRAEVAAAQGTQLTKLNDRLRDGTPRPEAWQTYLEQGVARLTEGIQSVASLEDIPDLPPGHDEKAVLDDFRAYTLDFASALEHWPAIRKAAEDIGELLLNARKLAP